LGATGVAFFALAATPSIESSAPWRNDAQPRVRTVNLDLFGGGGITSAPHLQLAFAKGAAPNISDDESWNALYHQTSVFSKN
jgi:hypothetical protein